MSTHLFIVDPVEKLDPHLDSTLRLASAFARRKQPQLFFCEAHHLGVDHMHEYAWADCIEIKSITDDHQPVFSTQPSRRSLGDFSAIHMRKDPPYDLDYIATTWMLDHAPRKTRVYNSPHGLRTVNEKFSILRYRDAIDPSLVSSDVEKMLIFIEKQCDGDAIVKPLTLYSGKGIRRIQFSDPNAREKSKNILLEMTHQQRSLKMVQKFNPAIYQGEVRAFTVCGHALAWCIKIPQKGRFMANSSFGSSRLDYKPSPNEITLVETVSRDLKKNFDINIVGFDLIGGKISEINVTSPRLLLGDSVQNPSQYYDRFAELIEQDLAQV